MSVRLRGRLDSVTNQDTAAVNPPANCSDDVYSPERTNLPRESVSRLISTVPTNAYATQSKGEAR